MALLERDQIIHDLDQALHEAQAGRGRTVLVSGEAGIGKTALVQEFTSCHRGTARVLWGACEALFTPRALGPIFDIARQTRGNLLELLNSQASRAVILSALFDELQQSEPLAIAVIEDIHWADEATLDAIKFLGRRIHQLPSLLIITYRDDELDEQHPVRFVLGDLSGPSVVRLRLPTLSESAVVTLAEQARRPSAGLFSATCGNPFFVTEVLASREAGVPATVRDAVLARAARLSPPARAVLDLASVVPARAEQWLLEMILHPDSAALDECTRSGTLTLDATALKFRHELARMAIEETLAPRRRQSLHAEVLKALVSQETDRIPLARLVHHATHAEDSEAVLRFAPAAARQSASLRAHREASSHYATALRFGASLTAEERAELSEGQAFECYLIGQIEEAVTLRQTALSIWKQLGRQDREGHNLRWLSRLNWFLGQKSESERYANAAIALLEQLPESSDLAMAYSNRAQLYALADEPDEADHWGARAVKLAERLGDHETLTHALNNIGAAKPPFGPNSGGPALEKSLELALKYDLEEHAARAYTNLGCSGVRYRDYEWGDRFLEEGIRYCIEHDLDSWRLYMLAWHARSCFEQGSWTAAAESAQAVLEAHQVFVVARIPALVALARVRVRRGDTENDSLLDEALKLAMGTNEMQRIAPVSAARAEAAWLKGRLEQCRVEAQVGFDLTLTHGSPWEHGEMCFWMWRGGAMAEPPPGLAEPFTAQMRGDWQASATAWGDIGCPYEKAMALMDGAEAAQREALEIFEGLGATPAAELVRQKLRAQGVRGIPRGPRPATRNNPAGLTARQLEVLALMSEGLQNTEIAARLSTSLKTLEHHVSAVLAKLNVRSRTEAVTMAQQQGLLPQNRDSQNSK